MYHVKMAFVLIQVGTRLWINPVQLQGVAVRNPPFTDCPTLIIIAQPNGFVCSDWPIEKVRVALSPSAVSKAMESK